LKAQIKTQDSGYSLITRERTEKLELLHHLVTNLAHAIVICGPEGIGKTRLLKLFQETTMETWMFCWVQGNSALNLIKIQELLAETIAKNMPQLKSSPLEKTLDKMVEWNLKVVLVVDEAGNLAPGVINKIIGYIQENTVIRVIFTLTHSELYLKSGTDPAIDDCYHIDIPPLSEKQCGDFLEYLSTLSKPQIQFNAINENRIAALYRETHGIPGNIIAQLPKHDNRNKTDYSKPILLVAVIGLVALGLGVQWWSAQQKIDGDKVTVTENKLESNKAAQQSQAKPVIPEQIVQPNSVLQPETETSVAALNPSKSIEIRNDVVESLSQIVKNQGLKEDETVSQKPGATVIAEAPNQPAINNDGQKAKDTANEQAQISVQVPEDDGGRWLMTQPVENYTLQLMALPNEQDIIQVLHKYQALGQKLKYLKTRTRKGKDRFVLLYGSFLSPEQVKNESALLPKELQKYWMRKIGVIQTEIDTAIPSDIAE
jgi:DamX protein